MSATKLTEPQQRLLAQVRAQGTVTKNGRVRKTAEALRDAGLITATWEPVGHALSMPTEEWTLTAVPQ